MCPVLQRPRPPLIGGSGTDTGGSGASLVPIKQIEAVKQYASILFPAPELIGLLMDLNVVKSGFQHVSEFMTCRGAAYTTASVLTFARPTRSPDLLHRQMEGSWATSAASYQ